MDLTKPRAGVDADVRASVSAELLISLLAAGMTEAQETFDERPAGFEDDLSAVSSATSNALARIGGPDAKPWTSLLGMAIRGPASASVDAFLGSIRAEDPVELWLTLAGAHVPPIAEILGDDALRRAGEGDRRSIDEILERSTLEGEINGLPELLALGAEGAKRTVLDGLGGWHRDVFAGREAATRETLDRDAEAGRELSATMSPQQLVERLTRGLELRGEPWVRRIVLVPHVALRPWNVLAADDGDSIICYPVADESLGLDPAEPPAQLLRLHRALGDDKRLRMLKVLAARGGATLQDLANAVGLAKSSAHYHLVILRSAGLVKVSTEGQGRYRLNRDSLPEVGRALDRFLEEAR